ncbi:MAG: alpha-mannosidase [Caldilinea sp. CFX5]|nr:alpha-mannosidase [Caldilinea sp. CFX5]
MLTHHQRWTAPKIAQRLHLLESYVYRQRSELPPFQWLPLPDPKTAPPLGDMATGDEWQTILPYSYWGGRDHNFMLRSRFTVPSDWPPDQPVALYLPLGDAGDFSHPEALVYIDGEAYAACDRHHQEIRLPARWHDGQPHRLELHGWTGLLGFGALEPGHQLLMRPCAVVQIDPAARHFAVTARVALGIAEQLDPNEPAKGLLLNALDDAFKRVDLREPLGAAFYDSIGAAQTHLDEGIVKAGIALPVAIVATGHAHIDVAWLWTLDQTRRKAGRTFHTVLRLMEQFPDYHFTQSQPQLYDYVRRDYPALFADIKERVQEGRWEPIGGMWVEADCNLSGSEALARQFLLGRSFFRQHFGAAAESPVLWLPDVFGYAWNLPQLIKQAGLEYFFTIKIGWSQYNRLPYDSFWWQGLDGTKVLTHFSTTPESGSAYASTYNANASPEQVIGTWTNFKQKELQQTLLMAFGYGDGGGGPTREMLENIAALGNFPAAPQMRQDSVANFFRKLEAESGERLPTWNGELYLELHRGTYTTQSRNKRANRKSEFLLHDAEFLASFAHLFHPDYRYPSEMLRKAWEVVCLNQFHDIIPGSSIHQVYVDSQQQYAEVRALAEDVRADALYTIAAQVGPSGHSLLLVNPTAFTRHDLAFWPNELPLNQQLRHSDGALVLTQPTLDGTWIDAGALPPYSVTVLQIGPAQPPVAFSLLTATPELLENPYVRVELNQAGNIVRLYDKVNEREVLPAHTFANQLQAFEDRPLNWDAWDVDIFYDDKMWVADAASRIAVVEHGPLRATLEIHRRILHSDFVQRISLRHNSAQVDIETTIDWRERHVLLKVAFPVNILAPTATYEIQWGNVERPTHRNTSWDWARFETCAHKWVDLSEGDYGVSLLNDCKYGHDIKDNVMRISLLRSPTMPDPEADQGKQHFAYSLLPHQGRWGAETIAAAYALNDPILVYETMGHGNQTQPTVHSLLAVDQPNIVIETVKVAEDGRDLIVRLYECQRRRGPITLRAGFDLAAAWRTNLLEEKEEALPSTKRSVTLPVHPYEIVTLRLMAADRT